MKIELRPGVSSRMLGMLPSFVNENDDKPLKDQVHRAYAHGGGWNEFEGFKLEKNGRWYAPCYPEDPPMKELARITVRDEILSIFEYSWVAVIKKDGSYNVARID